jgi:hypothetical protein
LQFTVWRGENPCAGALVFGRDLELEHCRELYDTQDAIVGILSRCAA